MSKFAELARLRSGDQTDGPAYSSTILFGHCPCPIFMQSLEESLNAYGLFAQVGTDVDERHVQVRIWDNPQDPSLDWEQWSCKMVEFSINFAQHECRANYDWPEVYHNEVGHMVLLFELKK